MSIGLEAWQWGVGVSEFLLFYLPCELWVRKREKDRAIGSLRKENTALAAAESTLAALESHQIAMERAKQQIEMLSKQRMELQHKMARLEDQKRKPPKGGDHLVIVPSRKGEDLWEWGPRKTSRKRTGVEMWGVQQPVRYW